MIGLVAELLFAAPRFVGSIPAWNSYLYDKRSLEIIVSGLAVCESEFKYNLQVLKRWLELRNVNYDASRERIMYCNGLR